MTPLIAIPFFGNDIRYVRMLHAWVTQLKLTLGDDVKFTILTDGSTPAESFDRRWEITAFDLGGYADVMRPDQPFDIKGAIMCEAALAIDEPFLMLDGDALLMKDPTRVLAAIPEHCACAMPVDHGAILHGHKLFMDGKYSDVPKMCAGVFWFGGVSRRSELVREYRRAWAELLAADFPWTPRIPHLLEQYAWSLAHRRLNGATLPGSMNWAPHIVGESPYSIVNHYFGHKKWQGTGKAPANV